MRIKITMTEEAFNEALRKIQTGLGTPEYKRKAKTRFFNQYYDEVYGRGKRGPFQ